MTLWDVILYTFPFSISDSKGSGVERYAYQLSSNLPKLNVKIKSISKFTGSRTEQYIRAFTEVPIKTLLTKTRLYHAVSPYSAAFLFSLRTNCRPIITSVHDVTYLDLPLEYSDFFSKRRAKWSIMAIKKSKKIIVPFNYTKKRIQAEFGIEDERIEVVRYGIDLTRFFNLKDNKIHDDPLFDVLFIGGVNPILRGAPTVLKTYKILSSHTPSLRLAISGSGPQMERTISLAKDMGLAKVINWLGFIPENQLPEIIARSRVFFYPSTMGFSYLMMQAMASSVPLVTTSVFDVPEFVRGAAIVFEPEDSENYAAAILELIDDVKYRQELVTRGNEVLSSYSPQAMALETARVYDKCLQ